jgi:hypothetical protein
MPRYSNFSATTPKKISNLIRENAHIVLIIYIKIYRFFNKILRFLKIGKSTKIFLNFSPSPFGSLEKIVLARVFKGQSAFFSYRF